MLRNALEKIVRERESVVREFALEAKREGFAVVGVFEGIKADPVSGVAHHQLNLERFMTEGELKERCLKDQDWQSNMTLNLNDSEVVKLLENSITAKDILQQYSYEKKRIALLEFDRRCIEGRTIVKVTNYNPGSGGITLEDKYSNRIESLNAIDRELIELNYSTGRVEKALELVRDVNEIGCDALLLKHVHSDSYDAIALALNCSRRTVIYKIKAAEELFEKITK